MSETDGNEPGLGGGHYEPDPLHLAALVGRNRLRRAEAVRTSQALRVGGHYARYLIDLIPGLEPYQKAGAGEALSLLGDPRFSPPFYLSEMLAVPAGETELGSPEYPDEEPIHIVYVDGFAMSQYPITCQAYAVFLNETKHRPPPNWRNGESDPIFANAPVVFVSFWEAQAYTRWLSDRTGHIYRLPNEAEWIRAARGDHRGWRYPWGDSFDYRKANTWGRYPIRGVCAVGVFPEGRGPFGHEDLAGNVWEWCSSLFWPYPYRHDDGREGLRPDGGKRVLHGGSWRSKPVSARCAARQGLQAVDRLEVVGFRIVREQR